MTNFEKHKSEIEHFRNRNFGLIENKIVPCDGAICEKCSFGPNCVVNRRLWLWDDAEEDLSLETVLKQLETAKQTCENAIRLLKAGVKND